MGSLSNAIENEVLDHILKVGSYSSPAPVYLGLSTADPTDDGSGWADPTYTGYGRKAITFGAAGSRKISQSGDVSFDLCTAGSSVVSHWGLWTASSGGVMMAHGAFAVQKNIVAGNTPVISSGEIFVEFSAVAGKGVFTGYANSILDWLFRAQALAQPTHIDIALFTTTCSDAAAGTEVAAGDYARKQVDAWDAASGGASQNTSESAWAAASSSWGNVKAMAAYDSATPMFYTNDVVDQDVGSGDVCKIEAGGFDVTLS